MKITITVYLVKDAYANKAYAVCEEESNTIYIGGLRSSNGNPYSFEGEAYHLHKECEDENFELKEIKILKDFNSLWENNISDPIDIVLEKLVPNSSTYIKLIAKGNHDKLLKFGMKLQLSFITMEMKFYLINTSTYNELHFILMETSFEEVTDILSTDFTPSELHITID